MSVEYKGHVHIEAPRATILTNRGCNLECPGCYLDEFFVDHPKAVLAADDLAGITEQISGLETEFYLGSEVTTNPDHNAILFQQAAERGHTLDLITNGYRSPEVFLRMIEPVKDSIGSIKVSIDSQNPKVHDYCRGRKGAYPRTMEMLETLRDQGYPVIAQSTVWPINYPDILESAHLLYDQGFRKLKYHVGSIGPTNNGGTMQNLDIYAWRALASELINFGESHPDMEVLLLPMVGFTPEEVENMIGPDKFGPYIDYLNRPRGDRSPKPFDLCLGLGDADGVHLDLMIVPETPTNPNPQISFCSIYSSYHGVASALWTQEQGLTPWEDKRGLSEIDHLKRSPFFCPAQVQTVGTSERFLQREGQPDIHFLCSYIKTDGHALTDFSESYVPFAQHYDALRRQQFPELFND